MSVFHTSYAGEIKFCYLLLLVLNIVGKEIEDLHTDESKRNAILDHMATRNLVWNPKDLLPGYKHVARRISIDVKQFKNYGHVRIITLHIDWDVSAARFSFQAKTLNMNRIGVCGPKDMIINLKRASYPAVNPDNYSFPGDFIKPQMREEPVYTVEMRSNGWKHYLHIKRPRPGFWYALVYIKWVDPKKEKVQQKGIGENCGAILYTSLQVKTEENIEVIDCYTGLTIDYSDLPAYFKCMTSDSIESINFNFTVTNTTTDSQIIMFSLQALSLPAKGDSLITCTFDPKLNHMQTVTFNPYPEAWHYVYVSNVSNSSGYDDCETYYSEEDSVDRNHTVVDLMRDDKGRFFTFEFGFPTTNVKDTSSLMNITPKEIITLRFRVNNGVDIGGNLMIKASMLMNLEHYLGYRKKMIKHFLGLPEENILYKTVVCLDLGHASIPLESGLCIFNYQISRALFQLFSTDHENIFTTKIVPFPESGTWYLTFRLFYANKEICFCQTHNDTRKYDSEDTEENSTVYLNISKEEDDKQKATVVLSVESMSCIYDDCTDKGKCKLQSKDTVIAFCDCFKGYGGWDCSDESRLDSKALLIMAILLLTLSNLFFLFSIYIAIIRLYFTEAVMYTFIMGFSTSYHACDAPAIVSECIFEKDILQFGDFYCGIMCFWVTLLAMSILSDMIRTTLQLVGAIWIGVLITWDKHSIATFMFPFLVGSAVMFMSWFWDHSKTHTFKYGKNYYIVYLPAGVVLVLLGLLCFAFLQTEQNYKIVHSFWHSVIALSVIFLLPDVRREEDPHPFWPSPGFFKMSFFKIFHKSEEPSLVDTKEPLAPTAQPPVTTPSTAPT